MKNVTEVILLAVREGNYTMFVFQDVNSKQYIMCTRLPNWQTPEVKVGDHGFLEYQEVKAGEDYYNPATQTTEHYSYSNIYFMNFVQKTNISNNSEIVL